jgi:hypothetical protein
MLYMYIPYLVGVPFNVLFLPYRVLVALSAYTLIGLVASIDRELVRQRLAGFAPARTGGSIFVGLAILSPRGRLSSWSPRSPTRRRTPRRFANRRCRRCCHPRPGRALFHPVRVLCARSSVRS